MKIGTQTNSLVNHLYSRMVNGQPEPTAGMGCTFLLWTDRKAATINKVIKRPGGRFRIEATEDYSKILSGDFCSESQVYEYTPRPDGVPYHFQTDKDGVWSMIILNKKTGRWNKTGCYGLRIGERESYRDPSF